MHTVVGETALWVITKQEETEREKATKKERYAKFPIPYPEFHT
jgi:hypothetical protein